MPGLERVAEDGLAQVCDQLVSGHRLVGDVERNGVANGLPRELRRDDGAVVERSEVLRPDLDDRIGERAGAPGIPVELAVRSRLLGHVVA